jgi:hypothetical protein
MNSYGFIITRHVNSETTNKYWNKCIINLRQFYPLIPIVIIDDNSNKTFLKPEFSYKNVLTIESDFKGRGELLPYYYYAKTKFFENAIIIHDSIFFHKRINFEKLINNGTKVIPFWHFNPDKENIANTLRISRNLKNSINVMQKITLNEVILGMPHTKWFGCFGVQSFINHTFLLYIEEKYKITNLLKVVTCRADRCCLERIMGCIFFTENVNINNKKSLLGNIMTYLKWGYDYNEYENNIKDGYVPKEIIKVWTGR